MNINKKIKIVHISHDLDLGGLQRVIVNICKTIDHSVFDVSVICLRGLGCFTSEIERLGITVYLVPQKKHGTDYLSFLKVAKLLRKIKPDVIHTHNTQPFIDGVIGALLCGVKRIIHTDHARSFPDKRRYMFAEWVMSHFAFKVVGVSDHTSMNLIKYEHISASKIETIPNGIDPAAYQIQIDKSKKRKELGLPKSGPILGVAVRLCEQKGVSCLLKAMVSVVKHFPQVILIIAGDGELRSELENEAKQLGIQSNVFFLGLRLDIAELLKLFDIYVLPSLWEGLPMILLEAMAAGCPVIASNVGGVSSAIITGKTGILVSPAELVQLTDAIIKLLSDGHIREEYSKNGLKIFYERFDSKIAVQRYSQLYVQKK